MDSPSRDLDDSSEQQQMMQLNPELELLFYCPNSSCICSFKEEHLLTMHMEKCGSTKKQQFICTKINCGKVYQNKDSLRRHVKECGQIFACDNPGCAKSFNAEGELSRHLRVCGGDPCPCVYLSPLQSSFLGHQTRCQVSFFFDFSFLSFKPQKINCLFANPLFSTSPVSLRRTS